MPRVEVPTQRERARALLGQRAMARLAEFAAVGITASTVGRMTRAGEVVRLSRGLYQLSNAPLDAQQSVAEAARRVPGGVICLASALAVHGLTDHMPPRVCVAIGRKAWRPKVDQPPLQVARFPDVQLRRSVELLAIASTDVPVFGVAKTLADLFRYRRTVGENLFIEGLRKALHQHKATPAEIAREAEAAGVWTKMRPYLMALTSDA